MAETTIIEPEPNFYQYEGTAVIDGRERKMRFTLDNWKGSDEEALKLIQKNHDTGEHPLKSIKLTRRLDRPTHPIGVEAVPADSPALNPGKSK